MERIFYYPDIPLIDRSQSAKIVFTNGCFDILHSGHVRYLEQAKLLGNILVVGINSDSSVKQIKGENRPVNNEMDRAYLISALKCVDFTVIFSQSTPEQLIGLLKPDIHVKGGDYRVSDLPESVIVQSYGGEVIILPFHNGYSTTSIIKKIQG